MVPGEEPARGRGKGRGIALIWHRVSGFCDEPAEEARLACPVMCDLFGVPGKECMQNCFIHRPGLVQRDRRGLPPPGLGHRCPPTRRFRCCCSTSG